MQTGIHLRAGMNWNSLDYLTNMFSSPSRQTGWWNLHDKNLRTSEFIKLFFILFAEQLPVLHWLLELSCFQDLPQLVPILGEKEPRSVSSSVKSPNKATGPCLLGRKTT